MPTDTVLEAFKTHRLVGLAESHNLQDHHEVLEISRTGWNSVLFEGSRLPVEETQRQTVEVVAVRPR